MASVIGLPGERPGRLLDCPRAESLPQAKRCSDAALCTSGDAGSGRIREVLDE